MVKRRVEYINRKMGDSVESRESGERAYREEDSRGRVLKGERDDRV